jgi:hypothetical protein
MRKILLVLLLAAGVWAYGANRPGFGERRYTVSGIAEYSYNTTWGHHGNLDVQALLPFNPHFEMEARLQTSTANVHTGAVTFRPKFELPVGELFIETDLRYRAVVRSRTGDITAAVGLGYRMDHVSLMIGSYCRVLDDWTRDWHSNENYVTEPFNLLYRLEVFCRPQDNNWNLSFLFTNADDYQMERMWQPLFGIGAWCDVAEHWRLLFSAQCKPTGMFHLDASFYGATFRTGFSYRF